MMSADSSGKEIESVMLGRVRSLKESAAAGRAYYNVL